MQLSDLKKKAADLSFWFQIAYHNKKSHQSDLLGTQQSPITVVN